MYYIIWIWKKMENSSITELGASDYDNLTFTSKLIVVVPDYINLITLFFGMYGMHQGIEIQHPLYSLLFINLFVSWFSSVINCIAFVKCPNLIYLKVTNIGCTLVLYFHSICWFLTTVIRHIYIVHDVWRLASHNSPQCKRPVLDCHWVCFDIDFGLGKPNVWIFIFKR